ncbi:hypothetical protein EHW67_06575 [Arenibacter aquaticus]|uniref:Uncharacterized protein n=1 Tax=Arenibacter aquaticus TaxID=2489054 RepID=A0A3S0AFZ6_9FLAO|nr:hypothetical protein [Arenibacter aquaticus]RTE54823.1 hypothetical protein EHW67_06575 [Arenibacter aquaticus]
MDPIDFGGITLQLSPYLLLKIMNPSHRYYMHSWKSNDIIPKRPKSSHQGYKFPLKRYNLLNHGAMPCI